MDVGLFWMRIVEDLQDWDDAMRHCGLDPQ